MKKIIRIFFLTALSAGIINVSQAQRGRDSRGAGEGNGGRVSGGSSRVGSAPSRDMVRRTAPARSYNNNSRVIERSNSMRNFSRGNVVARSPLRNTTVYNSRGSFVNRNGYARAGVGYRNGYSNNYRYRSYHGNVYGRRTSFMYGPRYRVIPHSFISINFGGYPYYYNNGLFYGYYGGYYQSIFPPFGLRIGTLPFGYSSFYWGGYPYYYYNGIYYQNYGDDGYQVVDAPMGATVSSLPGGATSVVVNGETLYELNGTYYKAGQDANGNTVFTVVGKNGVINNTSTDQGYNSAPTQGDGAQGQPQPQDYGAPQQSPPPSDIAPSSVNPPASSSSSMQIGDTMAQLPDGSKLVNINGEQLYQTPDNVYLKGQLNNGVVQFTVVGK